MKKFARHGVSVTFFLVLTLISRSALAYVESGNSTVLLMHFNEGDGQNVYDESSNGLNGLRGSDTTTSNDPTWVTPPSGCRYGNCFDFNDDWVRVTDNNALDITASLTLEAWVAADSTNDNGQVIISKWRTDSVANSSYILRSDSVDDGAGNDDDDVEFCLSNGTTTTCIDTQGSTACDDIFNTNDQLYHIAGTYNSTNRQLAIWVNGIRCDVATAASGFTINASATDLLIGSAFTGATTISTGNEAFDGRIDEVRIRSGISDDTITAGPVFNPGPVINAVTHTPTSGSESFVVFNGGGATINLEGWVFEQCSGTNDYIVPTTGTHDITAGGTVTVVVGSGSDGTPANTYYTANGSGGSDISAPGASDCLRVYGQSSTTRASIIDAVVWGADAGTGDDEPDYAGLWRGGTYVSTIPTLNQNTIQLFTTAIAATTRIGDNEEGVLDWARHPYTLVQGEGATSAQGDYYSATAGGGGRNIIYTYSIEVPSSSPTLRLEIWDADVGNDGGAGEDAAGRDRVRTAFNTTTVYRLKNPSGTTLATLTGSDTRGTDNTFMTPDGFYQTSPATGTWTLEVDATSGTNGDDINFFVPRAEGFQIKTKYTDFGSNLDTLPSDYLVYPWLKSGCSFNIYDHDSDSSITTAQQVNSRNFWGATTLNSTIADASLSDNDVWVRNNITGFTNDAIQSDYGAISVVGTILGTAGGGNYNVLEMRDYNGGAAADAGDADTDANAMSIYLPTDNGGPPNVPYLIQFYDYYGGASPMASMSTTTIRVFVVLLNFTGTTLTSGVVNTHVPGVEVLYVGSSASVTQGSITAQPGGGGSGTITWDVGTLTGSSSTGAQMTYLINVTPTSGGRTIFTGIPGSNGARATYTSAHSSSESLGQICELAATVGSALANQVELVDFKATPYADAVLLEWQTGSEIDNLGFNVYRASSPDGDYVQINDSLIYGLLTSPAGGNYYFVDQDVAPGETYTYLLEDVDLNGTLTQHGPVVAAVSNALAPFADSGFDPLAYTNGGWFDGEEDAQVVSGVIDDSNDLVSVPAVQIHEEEDAIYIRLYPEAPEFTTVTHDATNYSKPSVSGYLPSGEACAPQLLERNLLIQVPNRELTYILEGVDFETVAVPEGVIWPMPTYQVDESGTALEEIFCLDEETYALNENLPASMVDWLRANFIGSERHATIRIHPLQYNPALNQLTRAKAIFIKISLGAELPAEELPGGVVADDQQQQFSLAADALALKIRTQGQGLYRVTRADLQSSGFPAGSDPRYWQVFYRGREQAIGISGEEDGSFDLNEQLVFYAQENSDPQAEAFNTYWLTLASSPGLRMLEADATPASGPLVETFFWDALNLEENHFYYFTLPQAEAEDHWFWHYALAPGTFDRSFELPGLDSGSEGGPWIDVALAGVTSYGADPDHHARIFLNDTLIGDLTWDGQSVFEAQMPVPPSLLSEGANTLRLEMPGDLPGVTYDAVYLNRYAVHYPRRYEADGNNLHFTTELYGTHELFGLDTTEPLLVEISAPEAPILLTNYEVNAEEDTIRYQSLDQPFGSVMTAANALGLNTPVEFVSNISSNLHDPTNRGNYVILTPGEFVDGVQALAAHRSAHGLEVQVVHTQEIYDEFGYGVKSPESIKAFLQYAKLNWQKKPQYALLVGDGTYDPKGYLGAILGNENFLPSPLVETYFMQASSDTWYGQFSEDSALPELMIGRLPVETPQELATMVSRIIAYETTPDSETWERVITLVEDDVDNEPVDSQFGAALDEIAQKIPGGYQTLRISEDLLGGIPETTQAITEAINDGTLLVNYFGHGGIQLWASEAIFVNGDVSSLTNIQIFPVIVAMNCLNSFYAFPGFESLGEVLVTSSTGGAIAYWSSTGLATPYPQALLNAALYDALFPQSFGLAQTSSAKTLGQAIAQASLALQGNIDGQDVLRTFTLLGDPALELKIPAVSSGGSENSAPAHVKNDAGSGCQSSNSSRFSLLFLAEILLPLVVIFLVRRGLDKSAKVP